MDRLRVPVSMTYRAVGSGVGIKEFMGLEADGFSPINHFGSGDIPLSTEQYTLITTGAEGRDPSELYHIPVVLGAITLFHNIPGVEAGPQGLNMTGCLIARVFSRKITDWLDPEITESNPNLKNLIGDKAINGKYPITVIRRRLGSSSTKSMTQYMNDECSGEWPSSMVGKGGEGKNALDWHEDTVPCEGSGGVTKCINDRPGAIGYLDAGHGLAQGLKEIELLNKDGNFVSFSTATEKGGLGTAAENAQGLPAKAGDDFGKINLINQAGEYTWPVTAMSYIYVRRDWTKLGLTEEQQGLLYAFLTTVTNPDYEYIVPCENLFGFYAAYKNDKLAAFQQEALDGIIVDGDAKNLFTFETSTDDYDGHGQYTISAKRRSYAEYERSQLQKQVAGLEGKYELVSVAAKQNEYDTLLSEMKGSVDQARIAANEAEIFTSADSMQIMIALIMSGASLALWVLFLLKTLFCSSGKENNAPVPTTNGSAKPRAPKREQPVDDDDDADVV